MSSTGTIEDVSGAWIGGEDHTERSRQTFGDVTPEQSLRLAAREVSSGHPARIEQLADRTWMIQPGIANVALFETDEGLLLVDAGCAGDGAVLRDAVRACSSLPLHTVVFTHGHIDHAFGLWGLLEDGERPRVVAHENLPEHFGRYQKTAGLNARINFQIAGESGKAWPAEPADFPTVDTTYRDTLELLIGGERFVVRHAKGETDDASWVWAPERRVLAVGDLVVGYLPNAGNPRKVQRYAEEWADATEEMAALGAEVVITGHGDCVTGADSVRAELLSITAYLRHIVRHTLDGLNAHRMPDEIVASLEIPEHLAEHPRLQPNYDRPEFICRNVIRRYGGWWDRYPANLLPAPMPDRAREIARLAGGVEHLVERARELSDTDLPLALHLAEWAFLADPDHPDAQECYVEIAAARREAEASIMVKIAYTEPAQWVAAVRTGDGS
ncbi:alkyl sulfatase dimerization domain-containing protein [Nocardioides sambongensis]|uniref:alkyl sulfatase dimerization domain-containing protein n=1 Tax=Nocardioides sambongensis TaxID=2589074 RepID=UPI00112C5F75|nr:alkyl sulfatase dimerization domain-containing protein [Nocardioides sambongensis]